VKTKVLYMAILLVIVFSLISLPNINENIRQLSDIDITQIAKGENSSTTGQSGFILILGAFGQETDGVRRQLAIEEVVTGQDYKLYRGKYENRDILLVQTGMGKERAESATKSVLEHYPVTAIISLGVAGGLNPERKIGDVILCSMLYFANSSDQKDTKAELVTSDANLISLAHEGLPEDIVDNCYIGSSVTELQLDLDLRRQQELFETFHTDVVEMESYWIGRIASDQGIPFIAIRAISDRGYDVKPFDQILTPDGGLLWKKALVCFTIHPNYLINVFNLYMHVRVATKNLTACLLNLVAKM
jgi:adenosylhomocysteine nucleosidase